MIEHEGVSFDGQLADSSSHLFTMLIHTIHDFTVSTSVSPIQSWITCLENDLESQAMTKHAKHMRLITSLLDGLFVVVSYFLWLYSFLCSSCSYIF